MPTDLPNPFRVVKEIIHMCLHRRRVGASAEAVDPALAGRAVDCLQLAVRAQNPDHFRVLLGDRFNVDRVADPFPGLLLIIQTIPVTIHAEPGNILIILSILICLDISGFVLYPAAADSTSGLASGVAGEQCHIPFQDRRLAVFSVLDHCRNIRGLYCLPVSHNVMNRQSQHICELDIRTDINPFDGAEMLGVIMGTDHKIIRIHPSDHARSDWKLLLRASRRERCR